MLYLWYQDKGKDGYLKLAMSLPGMLEWILPCLRALQGSSSSSFSDMQVDRRIDKLILYHIQLHHNHHHYYHISHLQYSDNHVRMKRCHQSTPALKNIKEVIMMRQPLANFDQHNIMMSRLMIIIFYEGNKVTIDKSQDSVTKHQSYQSNILWYNDRSPSLNSHICIHIQGHTYFSDILDAGRQWSRHLRLCLLLPVWSPPYRPVHHIGTHNHWIRCHVHILL